VLVIPSFAPIVVLAMLSAVPVPELMVLPEPCTVGQQAGRHPVAGLRMTP
jgi:hypothetical protein